VGTMISFEHHRLDRYQFAVARACIARTLRGRRENSATIS
jgi:hypothetical protein